MSARKGSISRVTVPTARTQPIVVAGESGRAERPLMGVLQVVWRGKWIIACCLLISLVIGLVRISFSVPVYHSSSTILVQEAMPNVIGDVLAPNGQTSGYLYTQCEIIHSTAILTKALTEPGVADAKCLQGMDNPLAFLKNAVVAGPESEGDLITVAMDSTNANDAATIVNGVVSAYKSYQSEQHQLTAVQVMNILQNDIQRQEDELKTEQQQLTALKKANPDLIMDAAEKGKSPAARVLEEFSDAHVRTLNFRIAVEQASNFTDDALQLKRIVDEANERNRLPLDTEPVVDPALTADLSQIATALNAYSDEPNNSQALQLRAKQKQDYHERTAQLAASAKRYVAYLNTQFDAAQQVENDLKKEVDANRVTAIESNSKDAEYDQLTAQIQQTQRALDALYSRMKTVNVTSDVGVLSVSVLEPAKPSTDTIGTKRSNALGMAIVAGLMVGLGASLLLEMIDQRLRSVAEISKFFSTPILGAVPHIMCGSGWMMPYSFHDFRTSWRKYVRSFFSSFSRKKWRTAQTLMQCGQTMHLQPRSDVAEAYRAVRTAIYFGLSGHQAKTILITSPASGDGKTTLASNLAIAIAQAGRRVLLIDADCWRPAQQDIFGLIDGTGLTDVLLKKLSLAQAVHKTDVENLEILPCGELPLAPAELLESQGFADMLAIASERYDQILIDSPPVVPITDARILAATCDATILVIRAGKSTRHQADAAFEALHAVGAPILGLVVNDAPRQPHGNSYQYYHYTAGRNRSEWDQYSPTEIGQHRNGHIENGNGNGYLKHLPEIIDAEAEIDSEHSVPGQD